MSKREVFDWLTHRYGCHEVSERVLEAEFKQA